MKAVSVVLAEMHCRFSLCVDRMVDSWQGTTSRCEMYVNVSVGEHKTNFSRLMSMLSTRTRTQRHFFCLAASFFFFLILFSSRNMVATKSDIPFFFAEGPFDKGKRTEVIETATLECVEQSPNANLLFVTSTGSQMLGSCRRPDVYRTARCEAFYVPCTGKWTK